VTGSTETTINTSLNDEEEVKAVQGQLELRMKHSSSQQPLPTHSPTQPTHTARRTFSPLAFSSSAAR
jgi:hypothetical protein